MRYQNTLKHSLLSKLFMTQSLIYLGTWFSLVAINTLLLQLGAGAMVISVIISASFLPAIVIAPFSGMIVDRFSTKLLMRVMVLVELSMTLLYLQIDSHDELWILFILVFIRASAASIFFTLEMALLPKVVSGKTLQEANEIHSMIWSVTYALGMALGGIVVYQVGVYNSFLIDAGLFVVAFFVILRIEIDEHSAVHEPMFKMMKDGFYYLKSHPKIMGLILLHSAVALTAFDVLITLLADVYYKYVIAIPLAIGWLNASRALALTLGQLVIGKYIDAKNLALILVFQGLAIIAWGMVQENYTYSVIAMFFVGFFTTSLWSYTYSLIQENTDVAYLGRVVAYNDMMFMLVSVITSVSIGYATSADVSLDMITMSIGVGFIIVAFIYHQKKL